jgi:hypothetical protein
MWMAGSSPPLHACQARRAIRIVDCRVEGSRQRAVFIDALGAGIILPVILPAIQAPLTETDTALATSNWSFFRAFGMIWRQRSCLLSSMTDLA